MDELQKRSMLYAGLRSVKSDLCSHLGGNILEGDPLTFAPNVWDYVISRFGIKSVLDIGSGVGYSANYFFNKGMKVVAIDGLPENTQNAIYPTVEFDLTKGIVKCRVDLVHCQEVVEHINEEYLDNVLRSLTAGKFILLTNALPGQGGFHHVNEQQTEYWIKHLERYNCHLLHEDTRRIRAIALAEGAKYLADTATIFVNRSRL